MRPVILASLLAALFLGAGLLSNASPAASARADLTGDWRVTYSISCRASLNQMDGSVSGFVYCAQAKAAVFDGAIDQATGDFSIGGMISGLAVGVHGTLAPDGNSISGTWSFPPLFSAATFTGVQDPPQPPGTGLSGGWSIDILSGRCSAPVEQSGNDIVVHLACQGPSPGGLTGSLAGTIDASGNIDISGSVLGTQLVLTGAVADDGQSITGEWAVDALGLSGTFDAELQSAATATPAAATPTAMPSLPSTGTGATHAASPTAPYLAALAMITLLGAASLLLVARRSRR